MTRCTLCNSKFDPTELNAAGYCELCQKAMADKQAKAGWTERLGAPAKGLSYAPLAGASGGQYRTVHGIGKG